MENFTERDTGSVPGIALNAIRHINRLLIKEKDRALLLKGICRILAQHRSYSNVWIIVLGASGEPEDFFGSTIASNIISDAGPFDIKTIPECGLMALKEATPVLIRMPFQGCGDCPLKPEGKAWGMISTPLVYESHTYGILTVSLPKELVADYLEQVIIEEIAEDIAFAMHRIKLDEAHEKAERSLQKRGKELNYIFAFSKFVENPSASVEEIIKGAVDMIPSAMQFSEISSARIIYENSQFITDNFSEEDHLISNDIFSAGKKVGKLQAGYKKTDEYGHGGELFLEEEKQLINTVALRIGKIIERKEGRIALEKSERRLRSLVENALTAISILQDNRIVFRSPEHIRLFGSDASPFSEEFYKDIHPDDTGAVKSAYESILTGEQPGAEVEFRFHRPAGEKGRKDRRWMFCRLSAFEHKGRKAVLVNIMDISHSRELEQLMRIQDKMTSLGRVTAGIAHEIRNPLSGINIYLNAMEKLCAEAANREKIERILSQLQSASNKIESVIRRVMDFSKPSEPAFSLINLNDPVRDALSLSGMTLKKSGIRLEEDFDEDLPPCRADGHMIEQVVLNLITNASEALKENHEEKRIRILTFREDNSVCICVSDSGPGIPEDVCDLIFDPFFTTKKNSSGIGLSISHRIISDHNGTLEVSPSKISGAAFTIKIKAAEKGTAS